MSDVLQSSAMNGECKGLDIQPRDLELLRGLLECRVMTLEHAGVLHFPSYDAAKKRIEKLKDAGLIGVRPRRVNQPALHFLSKKGFQLLVREGLLSDLPPMTWEHVEKRVRVADTSLPHELQVMNVRAALEPVLRAMPEVKIERFQTWPMLYEFEALVPMDVPSHKPTMMIRPDGYLQVFEPGTNITSRFFLEVDRSSKVQGRLTLAAQCYRNHYNQGGFAEWCGGKRDEYVQYPFCVLMVFNNTERRNVTAEELLLLPKPILRQVWLTTIDEVRATPLGPIWTTPQAFRNATADTKFAPGWLRRQNGYRRSVEREELVEQRITKHNLFGLQTMLPEGVRT
jgi:hypothetical protein